jgi:hypothetical protein
VIVDGKIVVNKGQVPGIDESQLIAQATAAHLWQKEQFVAQNPGQKSDLVFFPTSYPEI